MLPKLKRLLKFLFSKQALSESLSWGLDRNRGKMRPEYASRQDIEKIPVVEGVRIEVFWKKLKFGKGPALSLFMLEEEILRIDCFGRGAGHMHACVFLPQEGENRIWMFEQTVEEQIDRAQFELYRNYRYYQARIPNPKIRALKIPSQAMKEASRKAYAALNTIIDRDAASTDGAALDYVMEDVD